MKYRDGESVFLVFYLDMISCRDIMKALEEYPQYFVINFYGNTMATKNLIANGLWIIQTSKMILPKFSKRNCLGFEG